MPKTLKDVAVLSYGKSPNEVLVQNSKFAVWGTGGVTGYASSPLFSGPFVLVGRKGTIDKPIYIEKDAWVIDTAYALHTVGSNYSKYLFYFLSTVNLLKFNEASGVPSLNRDYLYKMQIPDVHPKVQKRVSDILDLADVCIARTEQTILKLQKIKTGLMQDIFTRGIDSNGKLSSTYYEKPELYRTSSLGMIPKSWSEKKLGDLVEFYSGYAFKNAELSETGIKIVRISNLHKHDFPYWHYSGEIRKSILVEGGDVLFSWAGVASSIDIYLYKGERALLNQHIYNFKSKDKDQLYYIYYYIKSFLPKLRQEIEGGAGQLHLTKDKIESILVPIPDPKELMLILTKFLQVDENLEQEQLQLEKFRNLKVGLMQDLLTGKVEVKADKDE